MSREKNDVIGRIVATVVSVALVLTAFAAEAGDADAQARRRRRAARPAPPLVLPVGRAIGRLARADCRQILRAGRVRYERWEGEAEGVADPIVLTGPVGGVEIALRGRRPIHNVIDCRLAVALLGWAPILRAAGVRRVFHYSTYRPGARVSSNRRRASGHSTGLAIDAALFELDDGRTLDVLRDWADRARGADPCAPRPNEPDPSKLLRRVVCEGVARQIFEVVITPHHDDHHQNHVHLEVVTEDGDWTFVR